MTDSTQEVRRVDVIAVGDELLYGEVRDTNSERIAARLREVGLEVARRVVVGDDLDAISTEIRRGVETSDAVVITGGLGPTPDDLTREALACVTGASLRRVPELEERIREAFERRGMHMPLVNLRQAEVPEGARYLPQVLGTAPGIVADVEGKPVYALPGVPHEMEEMLDRAVVPELRQRAGGEVAYASTTLKVWGMSESAVSSTLAPLERKLKERAAALGMRAEVSYLPSTTELKIKIACRGGDPESCERLVADTIAEMKELLGEAVFGEGRASLASVLGDLLLDRKLTLACGESLTGGLVGATLTAIPGASRWFRGSVVAYSVDAKREILGVPDEIIRRKGAVSAACAEAMADGARRVLDADVGIACTGEAGPDPLEAPVGQVYLAVSDGATRRSVGVSLPGDRERIRMYTTTSLLDMARRILATAHSAT